MKKLVPLEPLLEISNLNVEFYNDGRTNKVLHGINLDIRKGEIVGLVGESGSGKSVTGLSILGLLPDRQSKLRGSIKFFNRGKILELSTMTETKFREVRGSSIAMIFQEPMSSLNPVFTCGYQVDEMTRLHLKYTRPQAREATLKLFERVGLPDIQRIYRSYPHQISGGQLQRVMIAMALSCNPDLLIADEPTTALDVTVQKKIIDLLLEIRDEFGISILFISHDLGVIKSIASRMYVMYRGRIVESGEVTKVVNHPAHLYTQGLIACRPPLGVKKDRLPVVSDIVTIVTKGDDYNFIPNPERNTRITENEPVHSRKNASEANVLLDVKNLVVQYPMTRNFWGRPTSYLQAVDDISFQINRGEVLGIVGESGCGKSTLGRTLVNLEKPISGSAMFDGMNLFAQSASEWKKNARRIQIIFQDPYSSLNPKMKVGDAILEPIKVHRIGNSVAWQKDRVMTLLTQVGMDPATANRYPHEFSGGQRQRISIARALALEPQLLICDESVAALDVSIQAQVLNLLKDLQEKLQLTMIFITHDISVVNFIADRLCVMQKGRIVETGATYDIVNQPRNTYTRTLIEAIPV